MPGSETYAQWTLSGLLLFAYLLGAIPVGLILNRLFAHDDIRLKGSGNIGATNVTRQTGVIPGLLTLAGDILKGAVPVYMALVAFGPLGGTTDVYPAAVALAAFFGHLFPVYLKFRDGGKGVATAAGCFAVLSPAAVLAATGVFFVVLVVARRVSVGSLSAAAVLPLAVWIDADSAILPASAGIVALFIFMRHRDNLKRLVAGKEPQFRLKKRASE
ncbi:MAG: glycerol-3-phosphate 1-O-acyltransferase PlsY [Desulfobacterales bacterium]|jgi:glycerol-3-phosphate acyltransferase PlsY